MDDFQYQHGRLHCEDVALEDLAARVGTPVYVYSKATLEHHFDALSQAFAQLDPLICYSIKSCANIHILKLLVEKGAGMDVVSGGELFRAQKAAADMKKVVFAGVGKTDPEIEEALSAGIGYFNIESEAEFENIAALAKRMSVTSRAVLRINPDVADPRTHQKTQTGRRGHKFGVNIDRAGAFFEKYGKDESLQLVGLHLHIGSPIYSPKPYVEAIGRAMRLVDALRSAGHSIDTFNMGGGFAADYESGRSPDYEAYADAIIPLVKDKGLQLILEPGRTIAANAGVLLMRVIYVKEGGGKTFVVVDAGMNTMMRVALYDAFHFIWPTRVSSEHTPEQRAKEMSLPGLCAVDIVGPICESSDCFATGRALPPVKRGDLLCLFTAGAYGMVMSNHYNATPRPPEVLVDGGSTTIIRERETYDDLIRGE